MLKFPRTFRFALLFAASVMLVSCGGGGDVKNELALRVIHASPDLPAVNFLVDGTAITSTPADYKTGTRFIFATPRSYAFSLQEILPGGNALIGTPEARSLVAGREYSFVAIGKAETDSVGTVVIDNPIEEIPDGSARLEVVHAAPDAPASVDVYLTVPGADLLAENPLVLAAPYGQVPPGRLLLPVDFCPAVAPETRNLCVVRITPAGVKTEILYESTAFQLNNRDDLLLVAVDNTAAGPAPVSMLVNNRFSTSEALDKNSVSAFRVVHLSPDAPALDVRGENSDADTNIDITFASGLTYLGFTGYVAAPPDLYTITGVKTAEPDVTPALLSSIGNLVAGKRATLLAAGLLSSIGSLVLQDDNVRPVFAVAKLRIVNAAPGSGTVDVYIQPTDPGTDIATVDPEARLGFLGRAGHAAFAPTTYAVTFTESGNKTVVASAVVPATAGTVQTLILVDAARVDVGSDGKPPSVLVLDDLAGQ
ncbi:MAG: DUF4397 domain-containing protein [Gammaproteobacteria bacterium]